jgi:hypothetical protein
MSHASAIEELRRHAGTQFDPELVGLFCDLFATVAPTPDPIVLAMISMDPDRLETGRLDTGRPDSASARRRRRRTDVTAVPVTLVDGGIDTAPGSAAS